MKDWLFRRLSSKKKIFRKACSLTFRFFNDRIKCKKVFIDYL